MREIDVAGIGIGIGIDGTVVGITDDVFEDPEPGRSLHEVADFDEEDTEDYDGDYKDGLSCARDGSEAAAGS